MHNLFPTFQSWLQARKPMLVGRAMFSGPAWKSTTILSSDHREAAEQSLVRILAIAHQERLDTAALVACLAREHRHWDRIGMERLAKRLATGVPLASALEQTRGVLSDDKVLAIRLGSQSGTLAATFRELVSYSQQTSKRARFLFGQSMTYFIVLGLVMALLVLFQAIFIFPTYKKVLEEFGIPIERNPELRSFRWLLYTADFCSSNALLFVFIGVCAAIVLAFPRARAYLRRSIVPRLFVPIANLRSAQLLSMLAVVEEQGRPIPGALSTLARYHFDRLVRLKLLVARNDVEQGIHVWKALSDTKLISSEESTSLSSTHSTAARGWMLRLLANWKTENIERRALVMLALFRPALILLTGAIVLWVATASIGVLSVMIRSLA